MQTTSVLAAPDAPRCVSLTPRSFDDAAVEPGATLMSEFTVPAMQAMQTEYTANSLKARRTLQAATFGSAFPMRRMMQEDILAQFHRLPGLPSSGVALDVLRGRDADLDFDDYLNLPEHSPELPGGDMDALGSTHDVMEKTLGIAPKAPF